MTDQPVMLITGASSGIGAETARAAARQGYRLVLAARSEDKLKGLQQELGGRSRHHSRLHVQRHQVGGLRHWLWCA
jgi:short-subunit dehydrogenase